MSFFGLTYFLHAPMNFGMQVNDMPNNALFFVLSESKVEAFGVIDNTIKKNLLRLFFE